MYNNQIFRNCFVFIHYHLTKVSSQINKCIIFEPGVEFDRIILNQNTVVITVHEFV